MPFSNDEQILVHKRSIFSTIVLIIGTGLFIGSLFYNCYCTDRGCHTSAEALAFGWLGVFTGGAGITWLANPLLVISWIFLERQKKAAWLLALMAFIISSSFLTFPIIIEDEAGHFGNITKVSSGYWLWLASCCTTFLGCLITRITTRKVIC